MMKPARRLNFRNLSAPPFVLEQKQLKKTSRRRFSGGWDFLQILALVFLMAAGLVFIHSIGEQIGSDHARAFFPRQLWWLTGGIAVWAAGVWFNTRKVEFKAISVIVYLLAVVLLVLVLVPGVGVKVYGATRWLSIAGFRLQPSELAKPALALALSLLFSLEGLSGRHWKGVLLSLPITLLPFVLIIKEPDLGSGMILIPVFAAILFVSGLKWRYVIFSVVLVSLIAAALITNEVMQIKPLLHDYQRDRIKVFLNPDSDRLHRGYNAYQARLAVGSGGLTGKGIGEGTQNQLGFLPQTVSNNDFIFSVITEETGFIGGTLLLLGYLALLGSVFRTAWQSSDAFGRNFAVGIGTMLFCQVFINIGMSLGLSPVTGLPLPLVSYGGSSIICIMGPLGILQGISRRSRQQLEKDQD